MTALLAAFIVLAVVDWVAVGTRRRSLEYVAKPGALLALLGWAATGAHASPALLLALAFSLAGDVFLVLTADAFLFGLASFLVAHLCYVAAFDAPIGARLVWLAVVLVGSSPIGLRVVRAVGDPVLRIAVGVYMIVISLMVGSALASGSAVAAAGAILFLVSDSLIAWNRFGRPLAWAPVAVMVAYHAGQLGLVAGLR